MARKHRWQLVGTVVNRVNCLAVYIEGRVIYPSTIKQISWIEGEQK
jgi:hypothetical protein